MPTPHPDPSPTEIGRENGSHEEFDHTGLNGEDMNVGSLANHHIAKNRYRAFEAHIAPLRNERWSFRDIAGSLNANRVPTPSGRGRWHPTTVMRACVAIGF